MVTIPAAQMQEILVGVTDFGDSAVLVGIVACGSLYMLASRVPGGARALWLSLVVAIGGIGVAKIAMLGCGNHFSWAFKGDRVHSPSGHTALSVAVYGACAMVLTRQTKSAWRFVPWMVAAIVVASIAATRVWLGFHSPTEVFIGLAIGGISIVLTELYLSRQPAPQPYRRRWLIALILLTMLVLHGTRLPAEAIIQALALHIRGIVPSCVAS